jgi:hypothetical protein
MVYNSFPYFNHSEALEAYCALFLQIFLNRHKRAHSPQLAAGLASESKICKIPYREDSLQACRSEAEIPFRGAAGYSSINLLSFIISMFRAAWQIEKIVCYQSGEYFLYTTPNKTSNVDKKYTG